MMNMFSRRTRVWIACASTMLTLTACGGGGDSPPAPPPPGPKAEGVYTGTISGSAINTFQLLVLENDEYWALYGTTSGATFFVSGFLQGQGVSNAGGFSSSNARDFGVTPAAAGTVSASYVAGISIQGSITAAGQALAFTGPVIASASYDYSTPATIATIAGNWNLTTLTGSTVTATIAANGTFTGSSGACNFSGTIIPRPSGKNVYNFSVTFGASPCISAGTTATGVGITYLIAGTTLRQLIFLGVDASRTAGTGLLGRR